MNCSCSSDNTFHSFTPIFHIFFFHKKKIIFCFFLFYSLRKWHSVFGRLCRCLLLLHFVIFPRIILILPLFSINTKEFPKFITVQQYFFLLFSRLSFNKKKIENFIRKWKQYHQNSQSDQTIPKIASVVTIFFNRFIVNSISADVFVTIISLIIHISECKEKKKREKKRVYRVINVISCRDIIN